MSTHIPTAIPYRVELLTGNQVAIMADKRVIALLQIAVDSLHRYESREETAAFIVRACNSHAALVAALGKLVGVYDRVGGPLAVDPTVAEARALLEGIK